MPLIHKPTNPEPPCLSPFSSSHTERQYSPCPKLSHGSRVQNPLKLVYLPNPQHVYCTFAASPILSCENPNKSSALGSLLFFCPLNILGLSVCLLFLGICEYKLLPSWWSFLCLLSYPSYPIKTNPRSIFRIRSHILVVRKSWRGPECPDGQSLVLCTNTPGRIFSSTSARDEGQSWRRPKEITKTNCPEKIKMFWKESSKQMDCDYSFWRYLKKSRKRFLSSYLCLLVKRVIKKLASARKVPQFAHLCLSLRQWVSVPSTVLRKQNGTLEYRWIQPLLPIDFRYTRWYWIVPTHVFNISGPMSWKRNRF